VQFCSFATGCSFCKTLDELHSRRTPVAGESRQRQINLAKSHEQIAEPNLDVHFVTDVAPADLTAAVCF
jgi:hypothetical protein